MDHIKGIITNIRFSTEVSGGDNGVSTTQVAAFDLDGKPTELKLPDSIMIKNGDTVVVAGKFKNGLFKALAYKNFSNGVSGKGPVILFMFLGVIFTIVGIGTIHLGIGVLFAPIGVYMIYCSRQLTEAFEMVTYSV